MTDVTPGQLQEFFSRTGNLLIHLLNRCNLNCNHCYLKASTDGSELLSPELVARTLDEAEILGISAVQFSGGEPLLYPKIRQLLKGVATKRFDTYLSTNATLVDDDFAALLLESNVCVVVSIDGPANYHDGFRGKSGCFEEARKGLISLSAKGVKFKVVMTVCTENLQYIDWCAELAHQMKAETLQIQPLENVGRAINIDSLRLSHDQMHNLFIHLNDLSVKYHRLGMKISMTYQSRDYMKEHPCKAFVCNGKKCHRKVDKELKKIVIREDGVILPELVDLDPRFAIGNLHDRTLTENILSYLSNGYNHFDKLCRHVYHDVVPNYPSPLIPWNEILSERSWTFAV